VKIPHGPAAVREEFSSKMPLFLWEGRRK